MILAIDIGNTTVALGGIKDGRVCFVAHMDTVRTRTAAEYRAEMEKVFSHRRHPERPVRFEGAVLTSVVPQITGALAECARHYTGKKPVIVSPEIRTGLTMGVPDPHAVGKDRIVDAAYAAANFPLPVITVDLGTATTFGRILTLERIPTMIATGLFSITSNKIVILILLNILMLFLGCLIEMACLILMLTPVILPIWMQLGLSPIHLGIVMVLNLGIGLLTPPVGSTLFIGSAISGIKIETLSKKMVPFYITMFIALIILTYFPQTFMWLPNLLY